MNGDTDGADRDSNLALLNYNAMHDFVLGELYHF